MTHHSPCIVLIWENKVDHQGLIGLFNVSQTNDNEQHVQIDRLRDGNYQNLLSDLCIEGIPKSESSTITVSNGGKIAVPSVAAILHYSGFVLRPQMFYSDLFDFDYKGM